VGQHAGTSGVSEFDLARIVVAWQYLPELIKLAIQHRFIRSITSIPSS
jgi:hypothetical protein